jgi:hypothetical protein
MTHEAVVGSYVIDEDEIELSSAIQVVCECGIILIESEDDDELLPFSEISDAVRAHQEQCD